MLEIMGAIIDGEASKSETTDTLPGSKPKSGEPVLKNILPGSVGASKVDEAAKNGRDDEEEKPPCCLYINKDPKVESPSLDCDSPRAANFIFCVNHQPAALEEHVYTNAGQKAASAQAGSSSATYIYIYIRVSLKQSWVYCLNQDLPG